jgi:hypothetical protein
MRWLILLALLTSCRDHSRFSSNGDHFEGPVVSGAFVRSGIKDDVRMCLTLDAERLEDAPGIVTTSDGRYKGMGLKPIPQVWHDSLSTLSFGTGRERNLLYTIEDVTFVVSLMQHGGIEVRMMRGAIGDQLGLFAVFMLDRKPGACSF